MALYTPANSGGPIVAPETVGALVVQPVIADSVAAQVSTVVTTNTHSYRIPVVATDPTAAWVAEGDEITPSDADLEEVVVSLPKLAGLTIISRELADDSSPQAAEVVGRGLSRDIARKLDAAYFGTVAAPAPAGLPSLTTSSVTITAYASLDPFAEAISKAEEVGATITAFVTTPAVALTLAQLKEAPTGSNKPLLEPDPTKPGARRVLGVPLLTSPSVDEDTVWALPSDRVYVVVRDGARVEVDRSVYFTSDRVAVKATMRVGFGYPHPAAVVKIAPAA